MSNTVPATAFSPSSVTPASSPVAPLPSTATAQLARPQLTVVPPTTTPETAQIVSPPSEAQLVASPAPSAPDSTVAQAQTSSAPPELSEILKLYHTQERECWLCKKIASAIDAGKEPSEDDRWHFTTCVLSWAHL